MSEEYDEPKYFPSTEKQSSFLSENSTHSNSPLEDRCLRPHLSRTTQDVLSKDPSTIEDYPSPKKTGFLARHDQGLSMDDHSESSNEPESENFQRNKQSAVVKTTVAPKFRDCNLEQRKRLVVGQYSPVRIGDFWPKDIEPCSFLDNKLKMAYLKNYRQPTGKQAFVKQSYSESYNSQNKPQGPGQKTRAAQPHSLNKQMDQCQQVSYSSRPYHPHAFHANHQQPFNEPMMACNPIYSEQASSLKPSGSLYFAPPSHRMNPESLGHPVSAQRLQEVQPSRMSPHPSMWQQRQFY
jgi:hypothetical protein